jgi:hypothetical protein
MSGQTNLEVTAIIQITFHISFLVITINQKGEIMATWPELRAFIASNYVVTLDTGEALYLQFDTGSGRSQLVSILNLTDTGVNHVCIMSMIGDSEQISDVTLRQMLTEAGFAGFIMIDGDVHLQHSVLMEDLNADEFQIPLAMVTTRADFLEAKYVGGDAN